MLDLITAHLFTLLIAGDLVTWRALASVGGDPLVWGAIGPVYAVCGRQIRLTLERDGF